MTRYLQLSFYLLFASCVQAENSAIHLKERITDLDRPWGAEFLPDGRLLVSEMEGTLKLFDKDFKFLFALSKPENLDQRRIARFDNSGAFDVVVDPQFKHNKFIYWSMATQQGENAFLSVIRLQVINNQLVNPQTIFQALPANSDRFHFGGALLFNPKGNLLVSVGERYSNAVMQKDNPVAQNLKDSRGKIWSIKNANEESIENIESRIIASGIRNSQAIEIVENKIWFADHIPILGDEINDLAVGANYGWPYNTSGKYKKTYSPQLNNNESNFVQPLYNWTKHTFAPSGLLFYNSSNHPEWQGKVFASRLSSGRLSILTVQNEKIVQEQELMVGKRLRDVIQSPDGKVFVLNDSKNGSVAQVLPKQ